MSAHDDGEHYGLLDDASEYGTALWLRWRGSTEVELVVLPDCPVVAPGPDGDGCCLFADHFEQHSWEGRPGGALAHQLIASPHNGTFLVACRDPRGGMQTWRLLPPLNESCRDCGGSGADSSGKSCGSCNGLGEIYCRASRQGLRVPSHSMIRKEGH
ncbi:hypothetical protein [Streptomyces bluensis]|uniref:hypothetical protein n=1 Tax=Streptomyces bluensis TaxID=33897 RepID=UPI0033333B64